MYFSSLHLKNFKNISRKINMCLVSQTFPTVYSLNHFKPFLQSFLPSIMIVAEKKTIAEELGIPNPPKRPMIPYTRFLVEESKKYSNMDKAEKFAKIGVSWRSLEESAKTKYVEEYNMENENYKLKMHKYTQSLTSDQKKEIKVLKIKKRLEKMESIEKKMKRKDSDMLGKPKHPGNTFSLYIMNLLKLKAIPKDTKMMLFARDMWNKLSDNEKQSYSDLSKKQLLQYKDELNKWEKKMIENGRNDLVRRSAVANSSMVKSK